MSSSATTDSAQRQMVRHVAALARLKLTEAEEQLYGQQLAPILDLMATLNQLPTEDIAPMSHAVDRILRERPDQPDDDVDWHEKLLACAPEVEQGYFCVPKVIE
ncbi:MAG: Asp-tRNA(Asn)/Glu-tRNA(Gln) amidotransferase subunit GatC [Magnetococcales bacterium]|nr:Asp-tRNA(Asn)/Glu-tRNA(Gln) amidotransferase subunit GatC [Magnetococcales bacterium]